MRSFDTIIMKLAHTILTVALLLSASQFTAAAVSASDSLTAEQAFQRQLDEERLAYQLYVALGEIHPQLRQFQNIPHAEARHFNALKQYAIKEFPELETFELTGDFIYPEISDLYDQLLEKGRKDAASALAVGVQVEELDIRDIDAALELTEDVALREIYTHLRAGSVRHLAAFSGKGRDRMRR